MLILIFHICSLSLVVAFLSFFFFDIREEINANKAINTPYVKKAPALEEKKLIWKSQS